LLTLTLAACKGKHNRVTAQSNEPDAHPSLFSSVAMNDPNAGAQLLSGFYPVENNAWRWTAGTFSVLLRTPPTAAQRGATLSLGFTLPDAVIGKLKDNGITASINGTALKSEKYDAAGSYVFSADVPASTLAAESVKVDFALDKSLPPGVDKRELGIIATSVGISPK
jgi:hypothetical protein